jgi:ABC-type lipoprotein export system ATPase subunit
VIINHQLTIINRKGVSMALIQTENLTKVYGSGETAVTALDHITMKVNAGEFVAVMGPSGCGKSTLLHLMGGLDRPTGAEVVIRLAAMASGALFSKAANRATEKTLNTAVGAIFIAIGVAMFFVEGGTAGVLHSVQALLS